MNAKNNDRDVIALAQQQYGSGNTLFNGLDFFRELHPALMTFARQNPDRAIEVREFVDLHGLAYLDKKGELSQILNNLNAKKVRDKGATDDDLNEWSARTRAEIKQSRNKSDRSSFWTKLRKAIRHRR